MSTPLATIADALIEFILSLLRDPAAAEQFAADPDEALASAGLSNVCAADVRAVAPVVVDRPDVVARVAQPAPVIPVAHGPGGYLPPVKPLPPTPAQEISHITNNFAVDARATIVDQSVNQNIWAHGDVNQIFDQEAVIASGDGSVAAGDDVLTDNSETDISTGDIGIGNTTTDIDIDDSFNDESTEVDVEVEADDSFNDESVTTGTEIEDSFTVDDSFNTDASLSVSTDGASDAAYAAPLDAAPAETVPAADYVEVAPVTEYPVTEYEDAGAIVYDPGLDTPGEFDQQ